MQTDSQSWKNHQNTDECQHRQKADVIQRIFDIPRQIKGIPQAEATIQKVGIIVRNDAANYIKDEQAIQTVCKESQHKTGNHFCALCFIVELSQQITEYKSQRRTKYNTQKKTEDTRKAPVYDPENGNLSCRGPDYDTEIHSQSRQTWNDQRQYKTGITTESGKYFGCNVRNVGICNKNTCKTQHNQHNDNLIVE